MVLLSDPDTIKVKHLDAAAELACPPQSCLTEPNPYVFLTAQI
jgi:hypothetical protein